nr:copia protein [Tanacetum cinerariifolium]
MHEELLRLKMQKVWVLVDLPHGKRAIGTKWVYRNKKDERGIVVRNKTRLVTQGHIQEEGIDYEEVFDPLARIEAIRLFLAYASFMGFMVYQMDVKSSFLYRTIKEEVYVCQPLGFEDLDHPDKVYKMVKALYASTPIDTEKPLLKDPDGEDVDVHTYRSMIGSLMYLTSSRPDIMFTVNNVTRLQALVDKKKVVVTEAAIREVLRLNDAEGVDCLPNKEIFAELACMGYEKPSTKLTFYKAFFSSQWKFLIYIILQSMSAKCTSWNEFSSLLIRKQVGDLSTHTTKYVSPALTQKVFANIRRVGKGFFTIETPLFEGMIIEQEIEEGGDAEEHVQDVTDSDAAQGDDNAAYEEVPIVSQELSIPSPTLPTPPPQPPQDLPSTSQALEIKKLKMNVKKLKKGDRVRVLKLRRLKRVRTSQRVDTSDDTVMDDKSNQGRIIDEMDKDDVVALMDDKKEDKKEEEAKVIKDDQVQGRQAESQAKIYKIGLDHAFKVLNKQEDEPTEVQEVVDVITTAKLITKVVTAASETVTAASTTISTAEPQVPASIITGAPAKVVAAPRRRRKGMVIRDREEESTTSSIIPAETKSKDKGKGIMKEESKPLKKKQQVEMDEEYARKLHAELNKDIDWDVAIDHVKLDYFKGMSYDDIPQKASKRRKLNEEVEDLKRHLEIMPDKDDDVYTEATTLARKVPVVDYEIINLNNKPYYKIIRANGTHQLFISFLTLLKNFDREYIEALWNLVKKRFSTSKPKNFSDDFLLTTLGAMFEKLDRHAQV